MLTRFNILALAICAFFFGNIAQAQEPFVSFKLQNGVSFELPRNWKVIDWNTRTTLDAAVAAIQPTDLNSELPFAANLYDYTNKTIALMNVRIYPDMDVYQHEVFKFSRSDLFEIDAALEQSLRKAGDTSGFILTNWYGTERIVIGNKIYLISKYRRTSRANPTSFFRVSLLRLLDGKKSFTVTHSYQEKQEFLLRPIVDHIIKSVKTTW